ncbi:hypothetical protein QPM05_06220 [Caldibacillus thermoamylovorans]|nr:hypothetical protein [Caldibacillus thermoamylovorans]
MPFQAITTFEQTQLITYTRTVVGWYNFTTGGKRYNINPDLFCDIVFPSEQTVCGVAEVTETELQALINGGVNIA